MSSRNQADGTWLDDIVSDHSWIHRFAFDRIDDIPRILGECANLGIGTLAVDGGDGTAGLIFSGLLNDGPYTTLPAMALLPSGKTNMTAEAWSLRGDRRAALAELIRRQGESGLDQSVHIQAVLAVQEGAGTPPRHGAFFGGAEVVEGILHCRRAIYPLGLPNALSHSAAVAALLWRAMFPGKKCGTVSVQFDNTKDGEEGHFFVILATTMDRMLLGMRPSPQAGMGPVHYMSLRPGTSAVLSSLPSLVRRRVVPGTSRTVRRSRSVSLSLSGPYTLDGEMYQANTDRPLVVSGEQSLRFIRW